MSNPIIITPAQMVALGEAMSEQPSASGNPVKWIVSRFVNDKFEHWFLCKRHAVELPGPLFTWREVRPGERKYGDCELCNPHYHGER